MRILILLLTVHVIVLGAIYIAALWVACRFFKKNAEDGVIIPMSVIKPIRDLDEGLEQNLKALIEADRDGILQVLFVMEGCDDPAYPIAAKVCEQYPARDVRVILSGPSGKRMGKVHNMIEGLKEARHPAVIFSDSDVIADRAVLLETSRAFAGGAGAACALPDASGRAGFTDALIGICFNHFFIGFTPLIYRLGLFCPFAGGWMAFRKDVLQKIGGLEKFAQCSADDFALGFAAFDSGAKTVLLPRLVRIRERGGTFLELIQHLLKWMKVIRFNLPWFYPFAPLGSPVYIAFLLFILTLWTGRSIAVSVMLLVSISLSRVIAGWIQDRFSAAGFFPVWTYLILPAADLVFIAVWFCAFFSRTLTWRGKKYRLYYGGRAEAFNG